MEHSEWQSLLKLGNKCFQEKEWNQAELFYSEAYDLLAYAYRDNPLSSDILMAWLCACHNLSSLYEKIGKLRLSLKFLTVPHEYLKEISSSNVANEDIKLIALKGMTLTFPPILTFTKKYPACDGYDLNFTSFKQLTEQHPIAVH